MNGDDITMRLNESFSVSGKQGSCFVCIHMGLDPAIPYPYECLYYTDDLIPAAADLSFCLSGGEAAEIITMSFNSNIYDYYSCANSIV